jgi:hypothetical protein
MVVQPNHKKLFIPNKQTSKAHQPEYGTDMRQIENWANSAGVQGPQGAQGAQGSSGGGGSGLSAGFVQMQAGPDATLADIDAIWFGIGGEGFIPGGDLTSYFPIFSSPTAQTITSFGAGWMAPPGPSYSAVILPVFTAPTFSSGSVTMQCAINAAKANFTDFAVYEMETTFITFTSGENYQTQSTDFDYGSSTGGDLTLTAGSGLSQNGLVTAGGGIYFGGISGYFTVAAGTTFT